MTSGNPNGPGEELVPHNYPGQPSPQPRDVSGFFLEADNFNGVVLDSRDPIENAMADLIRLYRMRRASMTIGGDVYATFTNSARNLDIPSFGTPEALLHLIQMEQTNINGMRRSGTLFNRDNDIALGEYMEMAFHATILYSWVKGYMRR